MRQKFEKFMQGRYGIDHFSRFLLVGALVCILLSGLLRASALNYVSWILLIWMYYRMFSKNIRKRCEEERMYMDTKEKVLQRGQKCDQRFQNTQNLPLSALQTENPCPEREGKNRDHLSFLPQ